MIKSQFCDIYIWSDFWEDFTSGPSYFYSEDSIVISSINMINLVYDQWKNCVEV